VSQLAQQTRDTRRDATLSRVGGLLATAVQADLAEAWILLEGEAGPVSDPDTTMLAVRRALDGDTVRALSSDPEGPRASVLLLRGDTLVSATAIARARILRDAARTTPLDLGLYLRGVRIQPVGGPEARDLPERIDASPGWKADSGLWVSAATSSGGSSASELVVAVRPSTRRRPASSVRTLAAAGVLLALSLLSAWMGFTGRTREGAVGPVVMAVSLVTLTTLVVSGWIALGEARIASADTTKELTWVASLVRARGLLEDPVAAQRWLGSPVYRFDEGEPRSGTGTPVPAWVAELPVPPAAFPASGRGEEGRRWLTVSSTGGRTTFTGQAPGLPPLLPLALGGSLLVLLGSLSVVRTASARSRIS